MVEPIPPTSLSTRSISFHASSFVIMVSGITDLSGREKGTNVGVNASTLNSLLCGARKKHTSHDNKTRIGDEVV